MNEQPLAIVAGGMGDIGRAIAERLARDGFRIGLLVHLSAEDEVERFLGSLEGSGHTWARCDMADPVHIPEAVQALVGDGRLAVCVEAVSPPIHRAALLDETCDELVRQFQVHVNGGLVLFQQAALRMRGHGGRLVGITSAALDPALRFKRIGGYMVAKAAASGILRELAKELAADGITVNAVAPGFVKTRLSGDVPERAVDFIKEANPMKLLVEPRDVAGVVSFLCSDDARAMTGVSIPVCGGDVMTV